jgi:hypothetical protein
MQAVNVGEEIPVFAHGLNQVRSRRTLRARRKLKGREGVVEANTTMAIA